MQMSESHCLWSEIQKKILYVRLKKDIEEMLNHSTSEITERYYVKRDNSRLNGITDGFEM